MKYYIHNYSADMHNWYLTKYATTAVHNNTENGLLLSWVWKQIGEKQGPRINEVIEIDEDEFLYLHVYTFGKGKLKTHNKYKLLPNEKLFSLRGDPAKDAARTEKDGWYLAYPGKHYVRFTEHKKSTVLDAYGTYQPEDFDKVLSGGRVLSLSGDIDKAVEIYNKHFAKKAKSYSDMMIRTEFNG